MQLHRCLRHALAVVALGLLANSTFAQSFTATGSMLSVRQYGHQAVLLPNGQVFVVGGAGSAVSETTAELYDESSGTFRLAGTLSDFRNMTTATLLQNGLVLIAGGDGAGSGTTSAELYDAATGTFIPTGNMATARMRPTATLLTNGQVLIAGGYDGMNYWSSAELYDPTSGTFIPTGSMATARFGATATRLSTGQVLVTGGQNSNGSQVSSAELYDPSSHSFMGTGSMEVTRAGHKATLLADGTVLITGGNAGASDGHSLSSAEIYDPTTGTFHAIGDMLTARSEHSATVLPNGNVLIAGGCCAPTSLYSPPSPSAELYDPASRTFMATGPMVFPTYGHVAAPLPSGNVLLAGGCIPSSTCTAGAQIYHVVGYVIKPLYDTTRAYKSGSTVPIKIEVLDTTNTNVSASTLTVHATDLILRSPQTSTDVIDSGNANPDNDFRFDLSIGDGGGYIYNLSTKGLSGTYDLRFTIGTDTRLYSTRVQVK